MAKDFNERSVRPFLRAMRQMYRAAVFGASVTNVTENQLRDVIDQLISSYNASREAWEELRADLGANPARDAIAATLHPTPADVADAIASTRQSVRDVLQAYNQYSPNAGNRAFTFDFSVVDAQILGGFTDIVLTPAELAPIQTALSSLVTVAQVLAPE